MSGKIMTGTIEISQRDIVIVDLNPIKGSEQGKIRPCIIVQNNSLNKILQTTIVVPVTSKIYDKEYPSIVAINESGLNGSIKTEQIRTIDKSRCVKKIGTISQKTFIHIQKSIFSVIEQL